MNLMLRWVLIESCLQCPWIKFISLKQEAPSKLLASKDSSAAGQFVKLADKKLDKKKKSKKARVEIEYEMEPEEPVRAKTRN